MLIILNTINKEIMKSSNLMGRMLRGLFVCALVGMLSGLANANNIRILGKPKLVQDTNMHHAIITFDIAWDNSWKTTKPENHDAAWIFVKCWNGEAWNHVYLKDTVANKPGSKIPTDAACYGDTTCYEKYYVSNRDASNTTMDMMLEPGFSMAWPKWKEQDPDEESEQCVVGFFLHRVNYGAGHVVVPGVSLIWDYARQGFVDEDDLVVKVFAVEMVLVPEGIYYLGGKGLTDGNRHYGAFTTNGATLGTPMVIRSEDAITVANSPASNTLWTVGGKGIVEGVIPAEYPKGFQAFYIMRYEMTQEAWADFLNTLSQGQQDGRVTGTLSTFAQYSWITRDIDGQGYGFYRNVIKIKQPSPVVVFGCDGNNNNKFDETDKVCYDYRCDSSKNKYMTRNIDGQDIAHNYVNVLDLLAYAEFSGLRPMTELEYEKACRGPKEPANDEFAWGSVTMMFLPGKGYLIDGWTGTEKGNGVYNSGSLGSGWWCWWDQNACAAPIRVGCFADSTTTRASSGATFWGVMNMSDNVGEICISAFDTTGRYFVGSHGCGKLDGNGDAINKDWLTFSGTNSTPANCRYFIVRGMMLWNNIGIGTTVPGSENQWAGLVSNRRTCEHTLPLIERQYHNNGVGMRGIRCVRTVGAER